MLEDNKELKRKRDTKGGYSLPKQEDRWRQKEREAAKIPTARIWGSRAEPRIPVGDCANGKWMPCMRKEGDRKAVPKTYQRQKKKRKKKKAQEKPPKAQDNCLKATHYFERYYTDWTRKSQISESKKRKKKLIRTIKSSFSSRLCL